MRTARSTGVPGGSDLPAAYRTRAYRARAAAIQPAAAAGTTGTQLRP
eukprot:SAG31_NODE_1147_length_9665_cov_10.571399_9_plen_47_part_00